MIDGRRSTHHRPYKRPVVSCLSSLLFSTIYLPIYLPFFPYQTLVRFHCNSALLGTTLMFSMVLFNFDQSGYRTYPDPSCPRLSRRPL
ncbi:hypothetical protein GGS24DRAFT_279756 [Hypoxylon argillaceum]|nr:hypothetical protein GGS24DRAFT_279756 [Hypoxylon argillaceum]